MTRTIRLPNGRSVSLATYVNAWRTLLGMEPDRTVAGFDHFPTRAEDVLRKMRNGLHDRINRRMPHYGIGRKWSPDWQREVMQTANLVNTPRVVVRWIPRDLKRRLAHRVTED